MLIIFLVPLIFAIECVCSQEVDTNRNVLDLLAAYGSNGLNIGASSVLYNPPKPIDGSVYLFNNWNNHTSVITTSKTTKINLNNINFNIKRNVFESKIDTYNIFTFDYTKIKKIVINNRIFKNVYSAIYGGFRFFEIIVNAKDFEIYKDYTIDIIEGSSNPLLAYTNDKYAVIDNYYIRRGSSFKKLILEKS